MTSNPVFKKRAKLLAIAAAIIVSASLLAYTYTEYQGVRGVPGSGPNAAVPQGLAKQTNEFGFDFYLQVSDAGGNLFFSPASMDAVFALVYEGARNDTAKNMEDVFGFDADDAQRREQYKNSAEILNIRDSRYSLDTSNALWVSEMYELHPEYVGVAKKYYDGMVSTVDFASEQGVNAINSWVKESTNGKIEEVLRPGSTDRLTLLVITNTIYFKGEWQHPFEPGYTADSDFYVDEGKKTTVKMMNARIHQISHMQNDLVQMIELPYKGDRLSMLVLLPSEKHQILRLEENLSASNLDRWKAQMSETIAEVYLPKFAAGTDYDLKAILTQMGMSLPFDRERADLGGISPEPGIYIAAAVHKAAVEVNELGTEAAAATAAHVKLQSGPPVTFRADHPFVYMIVDNHTGQILFMGRVVDPTA